MCVSLSLHPTCFPLFPFLFLSLSAWEGGRWMATLPPRHTPLFLFLYSHSLLFIWTSHPFSFTVYHIPLVHIKLSLSAFTIHCVKKILSSLPLIEPHSDQQQKHMSQEHLQKSCTNTHQAAVLFTEVTTQVSKISNYISKY